MTVPNKHTATRRARVAIIGEAPGKYEAEQGEPFVGPSGRLLRQLMARSGLLASECFIGNVCQERPPGNEIAAFQWDGYEIQDGLAQLAKDIEEADPNICLLLGNAALKAAMDPETVHPLTKYKYSIRSWRGTVFIPDKGPMKGRKCIASYHPAAVLRQYEWMPILNLDIRKATKHSQSRVWSPPSRTCLIPDDVSQLMGWMDETILRQAQITFDIEGGIGTMSCISVADSPDRAYIIPLETVTRDSYWEHEADEVRVWQKLAQLMSDERVPKTLQNSLYDRFVLQYSYGIPVKGVVDDTMLKHWELYCELEKGLGFQSSIYTEEPYYKHERKVPDTRTHYEYCCKDSMVTHEINGVLSKELEGRSLEHYRFNMELLNPILYMELRGIRYDEKGAADRRDSLLQQMYEQQHRLNQLAKVSLENLNPQELEGKARGLMCYKRDMGQPKAKYTEGWNDFIAIVRKTEKTDSEWGFIEKTMEVGINVDSPKFSTYLYSQLCLPLQTNKEGRPTADYEALLKLTKKVKDGSVESQIIRCAIEIRNLGTRTGMLSIKADVDGRIRCGYNVVGTETGRLTSYTSPTGSGYNLQTIPQYDRDLFIPDEDHWFFQCDLAGADGWTVAAHCKSLGDPTMFDDLTAGIKPARVLALGLRHGASILSLDRGELKERCKEVKKEDWDYFACKIGQHGTTYLMGAITMARNVFRESEGRLNLTVAEIRDIQRLFLMRYNIKRYHDAVSRSLTRKPVIIAASGHRRFFFGRSTDILGEALAHEPQANTTYATNMAASRLWNDPTNRTAEGRLMVEPLHQVHDAICGQFRKDQTDYAVAKLREWFNNPMVIAGVEITIPFEGGYGTSWRDTSHSI